MIAQNVLYLYFSKSFIFGVLSLLMTKLLIGLLPEPFLLLLLFCTNYIYSYSVFCMEVNILTCLHFDILLTKLIVTHSVPLSFGDKHLKPLFKCYKTFWQYEVFEKERTIYLLEHSNKKQKVFTCYTDILSDTSEGSFFTW